MRIRAAARVLIQAYQCQCKEWLLPLDFGRGVCDYRGMEKATLSRKQRRLLDGLCEYFDFADQVALAQDLWPDNYSYIRKSFSRLHNLDFIEWIPQEETSFEPRWFVTEKGVRYIIDTK